VISVAKGDRNKRKILRVEVNFLFKITQYRYGKLQCFANKHFIRWGGALIPLSEGTGDSMRPSPSYSCHSFWYWPIAFISRSFSSSSTIELQNLEETTDTAPMHPGAVLLDLFWKMKMTASCPWVAYRQATDDAEWPSKTSLRREKTSSSNLSDCY